MTASLSVISSPADAGHALSLIDAHAADSFAAALKEAQQEQRDEDKLREAVQQLIGQTLYLPLLKQARENPFRTDLMHGGRGEEAFGSQFDQEIADRLASRDAYGLADTIVNRMTAGRGQVSRHG